MNNPVFRQIRIYLYGVAVASIPVAVWLGWIEPEASVYIIPLLVALFNIAPTDKPETEPQEVEDVGEEPIIVIAKHEDVGV